MPPDDSSLSGRADVANNCLIDEAAVGFPHQIDHIVSRKHGGSSRLGNLAYACVLCNRYKGTDIAATDHSGEITGFSILGEMSGLSTSGSRGRLFSRSHLLAKRLRVYCGSTRLNAAERVVERKFLQNLGLYPRG